MATEYWTQMLCRLIQGVKPMMRKPMPKLDVMTTESTVCGFVIVAGVNATVTTETLNHIGWHQFMLHDCGYDQQRGLEWVMIRTKGPNFQVAKLIFCRKPPQDDSQPAIAPPVHPCPRGEAAGTHVTTN